LIIKGTIEGLDVTISGFEQFSVDVHEAAFHGVVDALGIALKASRVMLSATDHNQKELDELEHPYGFRHPQKIHDPDEIVHRQSGDYYDGLRAIPPVGLSEAIISGQIVNNDPKDRWIQEGTTKLRGRPWMAEIVREHGDELASVIESYIKAAINGSGSPPRAVGE
jgi:hypothetical protein